MSERDLRRISRERAALYDTEDIYQERGGLAAKWLTWGNQVNLSPGNGQILAEAEINNLVTTQILNVSYHMPTTWNLRMVFDFVMPNGETNPITVSYTLTHGVGQALVAVFREFVVNAPYAQLVDDQTFPAQGIQLAAAIVTYTASAAGAFNVACTAMVAPTVA